MAWATIQECTDLTGSTPDATTLALAQADIELHCNRTEAASDGMRSRDLEWLKRAVAYQAAWLPGQPGHAQRVGASSLTQDGLSVTFRSSVDQDLATRAQRALRNCSWMGSRSIRTRPRAAREESDLAGVTAGSFLHSSADPEDGWEPI